MKYILEQNITKKKNFKKISFLVSGEVPGDAPSLAKHAGGRFYLIQLLEGDWLFLRAKENGQQQKQIKIIIKIKCTLGPISQW